MVVAFAILYWIAFGGSHYYRNPTIFSTLLYAAWFSAIIIPLVTWFVVRAHTSHLIPLTSFILVSLIMGSLVWKNANFKAEKVMQYDFMACHQQWNRILETVNAEKPNNQIGVIQPERYAQLGF